MTFDLAWSKSTDLDTFDFFAMTGTNNTGGPISQILVVATGRQGQYPPVLADSASHTFFMFPPSFLDLPDGELPDLDGAITAWTDEDGGEHREPPEE
jgi:hypothetical protein